MEITKNLNLFQHSASAGILEPPAPTASISPELEIYALASSNALTHLAPTAVAMAIACFYSIEMYILYQPVFLTALLTAKEAAVIAATISQSISSGLQKGLSN